MFAALENLRNGKNINKAWQNITANIKILSKKSLGLYKLKRHKPWLDEKSLHFLYQRKPAKLQRLQDPKLSNVDNLNNVKCEASRHFRNKKKEHLKSKIEEFKPTLR